MDIILVGRIAEKGTIDALATHKGEFDGVYSDGYMRRGIEALEADFIDDESLMLMESSCSALYPINGEGLYDALWRFLEEQSSGARVYLTDIAIRQFCIAIADKLDLNPYNWDSTGCVLAATEEGSVIVRELRARGVEAAVIGHLTEDRDRCIVNGEIVSFLTPPKGR